MTEFGSTDKVELSLTEAADQIDDTANWCRMVAFGQSLSPSTRKILARAVTKDPSLTATLFAKDLPDVH